MCRRLLLHRGSGLCLNVVRSGRPEQFGEATGGPGSCLLSQCSPVWKTGTIGCVGTEVDHIKGSLNVVRSGRPEQWAKHIPRVNRVYGSLNVVRSGRPEQFVWRPPPATRTTSRLNVVRSGRPEQCDITLSCESGPVVSM